MEGVYGHADRLAELGGTGVLGTRLEALHRAIQARFDFIVRVAVALYDEGAGTLKTFVHSSGREDPLPGYETGIEDAPSLQEALARRAPRVVNDLGLFREGTHVHTRRIWDRGYRASYTLPFFHQGRLVAFIFFNARVKDCFSEEVLEELDLYGHLIGELVLDEQHKSQVLLAALRTAGAIVHRRDPETGAHLERMAHYARIIARHLRAEGTHGLDDEMVERIFEFAPLHDIGKVGIPDRVLRKPGVLDETERRVMRVHPTLGRQLIDALLENFGFEVFEHTEALKAIAEAHHEALDGSGYPRGLRGDQIPLAARIVAVADIFDALTSRRAYKEAWTVDQAFRHLDTLAGTKLDRDCVRALEAHRDEVEKVRSRYADA